MKLSFHVPTIDQVLDTTLWTQENGLASYWRDQLYKSYPQIDQNKALSLPEKERMTYVGDVLRDIYQQKQDHFYKEIQLWEKKWNEKIDQIKQAFDIAYDTDVDSILNDMICYINLNPICPRYLANHTFYVFYEMDVERVLRTCLHEIMHFLWFYKWQEHFHDDPKEYDTPHLKWIFSEMVQETMMQDTPIKDLSDWQGNAYDYFYSMIIDGVPILKTLSDIHKTKGLVGLFEDGFKYCKAHEFEIRSAIKKSENVKKST